ncbi:hypothetical protein JB92DRAFT_1145010 [Gautieria morchelliformis]|nr:hypothetical protein JB92DRAFT_1145010 [Gautieria morchelliformis]
MCEFLRWIPSEFMGYLDANVERYFHRIAIVFLGLSVAHEWNRMEKKKSNRKAINQKALAHKVGFHSFSFIAWFGVPGIPVPLSKTSTKI